MLVFKKRYCKRCGKMFLKNSKFNYICEKCKMDNKGRKKVNV